MKIKFNMPNVNELLGKGIQGKDNKGVSEVKNNSVTKDISNNYKEEENIITYFYHNFYAQAKFEYNKGKNIPESELEISLSVDVLYQAKVDKNEELKDLDESRKDKFNEEETSDRIYEAVKELSGNNTSNISNMKKYVKNAFYKAEKDLGGLPDISHKTLNLTLDKIDKLVSEKSKLDILA